MVKANGSCGVKVAKYSGARIGDNEFSGKGATGILLGEHTDPRSCDHPQPILQEGVASQNCKVLCSTPHEVAQRSRNAGLGADCGQSGSRGWTLLGLISADFSDCAMDFASCCAFIPVDRDVVGRGAIGWARHSLWLMPWAVFARSLAGMQALRSRWFVD